MKKTTSKKPSIRALANAAGIAPSTASVFLREHEDAPRDSEAAFVKFYGERRVREPEAGKQPSEYAKERLLKLRADRKTSEEKLRVLRDSYLPKDKVLAEVGTLSAEVARVLRFRLTRELVPSLVGLSGPEMRQKIEDVLDATWEDHRNGMTAKMDQLEQETKIATAKSKSTRIKARKPRKA